MSSIGRRFGFSRYAVARHRDRHVFDPGAEPPTTPSIDERLVEIEAALAGALQSAQRKGSMAALVPAARELLRVLEALHKSRVDAAAEREKVELTFYEEMRCVRQALVELLGPTQPELLEVFERQLATIRTNELSNKLSAATRLPSPGDVFD